MIYGSRNHIRMSCCLALAGFAACSSEDTVGEEGVPSERSNEVRFEVRIDNVAAFTNRKSGAFNLPIDAKEPGPLAPGQAYEIEFTAGTGHAVVLATMFGQSNDWFFATPPEGIPLFDDEGRPVTGDVTDRIALYDAGTEVDEEPAVGPHTGPNQSTSKDGPGAIDPNDEVREVPRSVILSNGKTFEMPAVSDMIAVELSATNAQTRQFTLRIENVADDTMTLVTSKGPKPVRISPGVWALAAGTESVFTLGAKDRGEGLEAIAEMGDPTGLASALEAHGGVATPLSPGIWRVQESGMPLWTEGEPDRGEGLEALAERGDISVLDERCTDPEANACGAFAIPVGASEPGPILPGGAYVFEIVAVPGERWTYAQMYGASNDWFFGTPDDGIALFDANDEPITGDITDRIRIWDAGTEFDEELAIGAYGGAVEGPADPVGRVRIVEDDVYATPVSEHLQVTITVVP